MRVVGTGVDERKSELPYWHDGCQLRSALSQQTDFEKENTRRASIVLKSSVCPPHCKKENSTCSLQLLSRKWRDDTRWGLCFVCFLVEWTKWRRNLAFWPFHSSLLGLGDSFRSWEEYFLPSWWAKGVVLNQDVFRSQRGKDIGRVSFPQLREGPPRAFFYTFLFVLGLQSRTTFLPVQRLSLFLVLVTIEGGLQYWT